MLGGKKRRQTGQKATGRGAEIGNYQDAHECACAHLLYLCIADSVHREGVGCPH